MFSMQKPSSFTDTYWICVEGSELCKHDVQSDNHERINLFRVKMNEKQWLEYPRSPSKTTLHHVIYGDLLLHENV